MYSDPSACLYCTNNETLHSLMIEICHLRVSRLFLFKEQTYRGRCLVAYDHHVNDLNELSESERNDFMADVCQATSAREPSSRRKSTTGHSLTPSRISTSISSRNISAGQTIPGSSA